MLIAIHASNLTISATEKGHKKTLLSGVSFEIPSGNFVSVIGASGCGKSTLIKMLSGLIEPSSGRILFAGHSIGELKDQFPLAVGYLPRFRDFVLTYAWRNPG